jgi:hypothetical protein
MPVAVKPAVFYWHSGILPRPESSDDRLSPILGSSPLFLNELPLVTQVAVNKLSLLDAFWVVTLCVCVWGGGGFLNHL